MKKIPPSRQVREELSRFLREGTEGHPLDTLFTLSTRLMLQEALEGELTGFRGRARYRRGGGRPGWRNGYEPRRLKTVEGSLLVHLPQARGTEEPFRSRLAEGLSRGSARLQGLVAQMYLRGLSTRDVEAALREATGERVLTRSAVSRVTESLNADFEAFRRRDLSGLAVAYLFLDALYLPLRQGSSEKEGVLCAYGVLEDGKKVLLGLALGSRESHDGWLAFLHDLVERGLKEPLLVCSDGNPGLRRALKEVFPRALKQRCQVHKMRNIIARLPRQARAEIKRLVRRVFTAGSFEEGMRRGKSLIARFRGRFPAAMEALEKDLEESLAHLKCPREHHRYLRTTNLLERLIGEGRRRAKVIPRFPGEQACLKLLYATLVEASRTWRGFPMTPKIAREMDRLKGELFSEKKLAQTA